VLCTYGERETTRRAKRYLRRRSLASRQPRPSRKPTPELKTRMDAAPRHVIHRVDRRPSMDDQAIRRSPFLLLPPELLELVALYLAAGPPNLGPPAALLPLLSTCRAVHDRLGWGAGQWPFWARIANAKFSSCTDADAPYVPYDGYPYAPLDPACGHTIHGRTALEYRAHTLRTRCLALALLRRGDPHAPGAGRALRVAYGMLVEEEGIGERLDFSQVDIVLGRGASLSLFCCVALITCT
jgi:hypothetical protein